MAEIAHRRYVEIMQDVEDMIDDHSKPPQILKPTFPIFSYYMCTVPS
jgi:hypothetical protein